MAQQQYPQYGFQGQHTSESLPPGWEMLIDKQTGWPFFVDHTNQTTTWQDPRKNFHMPPESSSSVGGPSPQQYGHSSMPQPNKVREIPVFHERNNSHGQTPPKTMDGIYMGGAPQSFQTGRDTPGRQIPIFHEGRNSPGFRIGTPPRNTGTPTHQHSMPPTYMTGPQRTGSPGPNDNWHEWSRPRPHPQGFQSAQTQPPPTSQPGTYVRQIPIFHERSQSQDRNQSPVPQNRPAQMTTHFGPDPNQSQQTPPFPMPSPPAPQQQRPTYPLPPDVQPHHQQPETQPYHVEQPPPQPSFQAPPQVNTPPARATPPPAQDSLRPEEPPAKARSPSPMPAHLTTLEQIDLIMSETESLRTKAESFTGEKKDKTYLYVEEMLTRLLIKLDRIDSEGKDEIRQARRTAVKTVQAVLDQLELKLLANATPMPAQPDSAADSTMNNSQSSGESKSADPSSVKDMVVDGGISC